LSHSSALVLAEVTNCHEHSVAFQHLATHACYPTQISVFVTSGRDSSATVHGAYGEPQHTVHVCSCVLSFFYVHLLVVVPCHVMTLAAKVLGCCPRPLGGTPRQRLRALIADTIPIRFCCQTFIGAVHRVMHGNLQCHRQLCVCALFLLLLFFLLV
jgi:hypothetical protein